MLEFLQKYDYLFLPYISQILRVVVIPFTALGVVYIVGKLLEIVNTDKAKNRLAFICIAMLSVATGNHEGDWFVSYDFFFEAFIVTCLSTIFYVTVCWRFFSRMDSLLDTKMGKDNYDAQKEQDRKKKELALKLRKEKKENKELAEANRKLEASRKRLEKKKLTEKE